ncbi:MAG TPA: cytochrome c biogenesis protein CcdA [Euryarchaeota archaeon]|nr:thiol:disulfide interchange protein DsbD precursor [archaeon BMS3Abin16]GBE56141.1 thiol:disulfide interchange protein DsbD precursor [archaeon BMS3Bbin16]HDH28981.1 cytochrome c biogenesis protein CcdA [Euryarchaeota archaeon]HDY74337.1 cytochrome c biogenesis protein CcdA [Euryarchaeota archaeon]
MVGFEPSFLLAFLAGVVTIATPCVLPILPPLLAGSVGHRLRPVLIVLGSTVTFTLMGGVFSVIGIAAGGFGNALRLFFIALIIGFGAVWVDSDINDLYTKYSSLLLNRFYKPSARRGDESLFGAFVLGLSLGIVWIPCVGPILGAVLSLVAIEGNLVTGSLMLTSYSIGLGIPMLAIAYGGKKVSAKLDWTRSNSETIKKLAGWILIATGLAMLFGVDQWIQRLLLPYFPEFETQLMKLF